MNLKLNTGAPWGALLALLALLAVSCQTPLVGTSSASTVTPLVQNTFEPQSQADVDLAVAKGHIVAGSLILKASASFDPTQAQKLGAQIAGHFTLGPAVYYRLTSTQGTYRLAQALKRLPGVAYVQFDLRSTQPVAEPAASSSSRNAASLHAAFPNDPETWGRFGHFEVTKALDAYKNHPFPTDLAAPIYVVDVDTGLNVLHEDFQGETGPIVEYARSAFVPTEGGFSYVGEGTPFVVVPLDENWDDEGHGTHTAGTIAALGDNGVGVAGVAWKNVRLISYKCFANAPGSGSDWAVYGGLADLIQWKTENEIDQTIPVNMSLGGSYAGPYELDMINAALAHNIVVIASMGNEGYNRAQYPAAYPGVIAVGAAKADGTKVSFSQSGSFISVMAPGYNIYSTGSLSSDDYEDMSGTSMAAPFVTGTVAYMLQFNPTLTPGQIRTILEKTAMDMGPAGFDEDTGYGLVNVNAAVALAQNPPAAGSVYSEGVVKVTVTNENEAYSSGIEGLEGRVLAQPVYVYDAAGSCVAVGLTSNEDGTVEFRDLKVGSYTFKAPYVAYGGAVVVSGTGSAPAGASSTTVAVDLVLDNPPPLLVQTSPNFYFDDFGADTVIDLYTAEGFPVAHKDVTSFDTLAVPSLVSGATYLINITPYWSEGYFVGEYLVSVGFAPLYPLVETERTPGDPADGIGTSPETATPLTLEEPVSAYLDEAGDWYSFVAP